MVSSLHKGGFTGTVGSNSIKRYIKESKGLKVKIEIEGWKMKSKATKRDKKESKR